MNDNKNELPKDTSQSDDIDASNFYPIDFRHRPMPDNWNACQEGTELESDEYLRSWERFGDRDIGFRTALWCVIGFLFLFCLLIFSALAWSLME